MVTRVDSRVAAIMVHDRMVEVKVETAPEEGVGAITARHIANIPYRVGMRTVLEIGGRHGLKRMELTAGTPLCFVPEGPCMVLLLITDAEEFFRFEGAADVERMSFNWVSGCWGPVEEVPANFLQEAV